MDRLQHIWRTRQDDIRTIVLSVSVSILTSLAFSAYITTRSNEEEPLTRNKPSPDQTQKRPSKRDSLPIPPILTAADHLHDNKHHLLLCATGSVATIKLPLIITTLLTRHTSSSLSIRILLTPSAAQFLQSQSPEQPSLSALAAIPGVDGIYLDADEWRRPWTRGASILHIELRRWADLMVIAPLSANSLAKVAGGMAEGLVASVVRAWDSTGEIDGPRELVSAEEGTGGSSRGSWAKRIVVAPAMNTAMWEHPVTRKHLAVLEGEWGVANGGWIEVLRPVEKTLACGDTGSGAMREWKQIVDVIEQRLGLVDDDTEDLGKA